MEAFNKLNEDFNNASRSNRSDNYVNLSHTLSRFEASLREYLQHKTRDQLKKVIAKLKGTETIGSDDLRQIRLWVVGDAEYYTRLENNFKDWQKELNRLVDEISRSRTDEPDTETAAHLRGLLLDGIRVLNNISFLAEEKERIAKFEEATRTLEPDERALLVRILEQKINSPDF